MSAPFSLANLFSAFLGLPRTVSSRAPTYSADEFARLAGGRGCFVVVRGNPFADLGYADDAIVDAVIAAMQGQNPGIPTHFTARPSSAASSDHHVALLLNGGPTVRAADICSAMDLPSVSEPLGPRGRLRILAAWCRDDVVLSEVSGRIDGVRAPTDDRFMRLIAQVIRELFPVLADPGGLKGH